MRPLIYSLIILPLLYLLADLQDQQLDRIKVVQALQSEEHSKNYVFVEEGIPLLRRKGMEEWLYVEDGILKVKPLNQDSNAYHQWAIDKIRSARRIKQLHKKYEAAK